MKFNRYSICRLCSLCLLLFIGTAGFGQKFDYFLSGNPTSVDTDAEFGICLMGGATEVDEASKWFLEKAAGGDVLVLRTSGSDGYQDYFFEELGVPVNRVETIVLLEDAAAYDPFVLQKVEEAEAIWFAGGDQYQYMVALKSTPLNAAIQAKIDGGNLSLGGTSAGAMILGDHIFTAKNGTLLSADALADPYDMRVVLDNYPLFDIQVLENILIDTHFDNPERLGRAIVFIARIKQALDIGITVIGLEEYTALCLEADGSGIVFGNSPEYEDQLHVVRANCAIVPNEAEVQQPSNPLTWNQGAAAVAVYKLEGTIEGNAIPDVADQESYVEGSWQYAGVDNGILSTTDTSNPSCSPTYIKEFTKVETATNMVLHAGQLPSLLKPESNYSFFNMSGEQLASGSASELQTDLEGLSAGLYIFQYRTDHSVKVIRTIVSSTVF